jgi:hypothetical protein
MRVEVNGDNTGWWATRVLKQSDDKRESPEAEFGLKIL